MVFRFTATLLLFGSLVLSGCVSSGTYQLKEQESQRLGRNLEEARGQYAELQKKYGKLEDENADLAATIKKQKGELADAGEKNGKISEQNGELADKLKKLTADLGSTRGEVERESRANADLSDKLKKLAVDFVDLKTEKDKLALINNTLSGKVGRQAAEIAELKLANEKLATAVKPENLLKTVGEYFESQQKQLDGLATENAKLKQTIMEMRGLGRLPGGESSSRSPEAKPAPVAAKPVTPPAPAPPVKPQPARVQEEKPRPQPLAVKVPVPVPPVENPAPPTVVSEAPRQEGAKAEPEEAPTTIHIPGEEPISLPPEEK